MINLQTLKCKYNIICCTGRTLLLKCYLYLMFQYCCDSDGEDEVVNLEPIYESSKSYHHRQLPDIIGTTDFMVRYNHIIINSITF